MQLPFTVEQFFDVFGHYNTDLPYAWLVLSILAVAGAVSAFIGYGRVPLVVLSFLWIWSGAVYQIGYFSGINSLANVFGGAFILQGVLFLIAAARGASLSAVPFAGWRIYIGAVFIVFALFVYPGLGTIFGHSFPRTPTFGHPCPLSIFTFGLLLWIGGSVPKYLVVIPLLWSLVGTSASVLFGVWEDISLLVAGIVSASLLLWPRNRA